MPTLYKFMTNTRRSHKHILEALQVYYPGAVAVSDCATAQDGSTLEDYIAVHVGHTPLPDYSEFWQEFNRLLTLHGFRN